MKKLIALVVVLVASILGSTLQGSTLIDLGVGNSAKSINNANEVVGTTSDDHVFKWSQSDGMVDLYPLVTLSPRLRVGINQKGDVCGSYLDPITGLKTPAIRKKNGEIEVIGVAKGQAVAINKDDEVAGTIDGAYEEWQLPHAFFYDKHKVMHDLNVCVAGTPPEHCGSYGWNLNDKGEIVGQITTVADNEQVHLQACKWKNGNITTIESPIGNIDGVALGINNEGDITGAFLFTSLGVLGFMQTHNHHIFNFSLPPISGVTNGYGINSNGTVVGGTYIPPGVPRAIKYENGITTDLNTGIDKSSITASWASDINNAGWITGEGTDQNGNTHAIVIIP